jgi:hypothetical protein
MANSLNTITVNGVTYDASTYKSSSAASISILDVDFDVNIIKHGLEQRCIPAAAGHADAVSGPTGSTG